MIDDQGSATPRPEVVNRVVAWHNRHPLARRITPAQVRHVGLVVLPFAAPGAPASVDIDLEPSGLASHASQAPDLPEPVVLTAQPTLDDEADAAAELLMGGPTGDTPPPNEPQAETADDPSGQATGAAEDANPPTDATPAEIPAADTVADAPALHAEHPAPHEAPPIAHALEAAAHGAEHIDLDVEEAHAPARPVDNVPMPVVARTRWWQRLFRRTPQAAGTPALFTENLVPDLGVEGLTALALKHGMTERPPGEQWLSRTLPVDRNLADQAADAGMGARADRLLLTATIDDGSRRLRLLIGGGLKPHITGPHLWDRRRVGAAAGAALIALSATAWAVGRQSGQAAAAAQAKAVAAAAAASAASAASTAASAAAALAASQAQAAAAASSAASGVEVAASAPVDSRDVSASAPDTGQANGQTDGHPAHPNESNHPAVAATPAPPAPEPAAGLASGPASAPRSIVPNLRPQLARAAQVDNTQQFALVSVPLRTGTEAQALLRRLREETARVRHPVAIETSAHQSAQGWRVSWWPFANRRQADNARAALADRHLDMEVVEF